MLKFGAFLTIIMFAAKALTVWAGDRGAYVLAAVSGIADVDAVTLSMSRLSQTSLGMDTAAAAIFVAAAVNSISKVVLGWAAGGVGPGKDLAIGAGVALTAGALGMALAPLVVAL